MGDMAEYYSASSISEEDYPHGRIFERRSLAALTSSSQRLPRTWITAEGHIIQIADMKNSHLRNTIELLRRTALGNMARSMNVTDDDVIGAFLLDPDERALAAWGDVYSDLLDEALFRSDGDLQAWMVL